MMKLHFRSLRNKIKILCVFSARSFFKVITIKMILIYQMKMQLNYFYSVIPLLHELLHSNEQYAYAYTNSNL